MLLRTGGAQGIREVLTVEDVVAPGQAARIFADELFADYESLCQTVRTRLLGVSQLDAVQAAITQQLAEAWQVLRRGDNQDFTHPRKHQHRQRIEDHRLVEDWQHLLGHAEGQRMQARTRAPAKMMP